jgi:rod shape-determining protein MreC
MVNWIKRFSLFFTALFFLLLAVVIFSFRSGEDRDTPLVQKIFMQITFPFQGRVHGAVTWVRQIGHRYILLIDIKEENEKLKHEVSALREENNRLQERILAEERLQKLTPIQSQYSSPSILAQVYARDPSNWFKSILVDKGSNEEVLKNMAVVAADGVVGRVMEASADTAKVLLITDPNSAVDVLLQRSRSQAILEGTAEEICILKYVQKSDDVQVGDKVITSGMGGIFPKGLMTGTVTKLDKKRPGIFQYVEVTPGVDFSRLEEVLILGEEEP